MDDDLRLDHVVIRVRDLDEAMRDYRQLGFTVVPGGSHENGPTHNALIGLDDDSYLELIAFRPVDAGSTRAGGLMHRWQEREEGLVAFALVPEAIEPVIARVRGAGLAIDGPTGGGRRRPDGQQVAWQVGVPESPELPFLCADVTPRSLRLPDAESCRHENGACGIADLIVAVSDLEASAARYAAMLGVEAPRPWFDPLLRTSVVSCHLGEVTVVLAAPATDGTWSSEHLAQRGEGPCSLTLATTKSGAVGPLDAAQAHGARVTLVVA